MSGVMTKVAVYGFLRTYSTCWDTRWWWSVVVPSLAGIPA